jgi:hypothetical protein
MSKPRGWTAFDREGIRRARLELKLSWSETAERFGCSIPTAKRAVRRGSTLGPGTASRGVVLKPDHPAARDAHSFFEKSIRDPDQGPVLKTGMYSGKLGRSVTKGWWKGMPIYTLKLEERATCPSSCRQWLTCYGNNMPFAHRYRHGLALERAIVDEVAALSARHPRGFVVRLHDLGDFYSEHYAYLWGGLVGRYEQLHIFGYTARQDLKRDPTARAIKYLTDMYWPRFAIRWSDGPGTTRNTIAIETALDCPEDAIICPAQTHRVERCGDCGLCWTSERRIAFLQH